MRLSDFGVSVVIPLYNKAPYIRRTLLSVLAQSRAADEIVIVDDGSTDGSVAAIADLVGGTVRIVAQPNGGPGAARNGGIEAATQPWIAFIDGDDLWRPDHLATIEELARTFPAADLLATGNMFARSDECAIPLAPAGGATRGEALDYFTEIAEPSTICSSSVAVATGPARRRGVRHVLAGEDRDLWLRLALDHIFAAAGRCTAIYVKQTGGLIDAFESQQVGFFMPPVYATIARACDDPRHADRHADIRTYYRRALRRNVRQALYRGEGAAARAYIRELEKLGPARLGVLRPLAWLPPSILRAGMKVRSRLRADRHA